MKEIRLKSKWVTTKEICITVDSDVNNPNGYSLNVPRGTVLTWDGDAPNGNVWFYALLGENSIRGKIESGAITNLVKRGMIELQDAGDSFIIYNGDYLKKLLAQ